MVFPHTIITKNAQETAAYGQTLGSLIRQGLAQRGKGSRHAVIVCLFGELGSGKTTFAQGLARGLGVVSTRVLSPTFIIVRRYQTEEERFFYHVDLYRVEADQVRGVDLDGMLTDPDAIVAIEWPDKILDKLPSRRYEVRFQSAVSCHTIRLQQLGFDLEGSVAHG